MNPIYQFLKENNLTTKDEKTFEKDYSDTAKAKELYGFFQENKLTQKDFNSFYDSYFKKKEVSQPALEAGGKAGTSALPSGLTPRTDVVEFKEPKVSGEDTALARRIQRQQQQAIASTGVKLPAAPKVVAEEKAAQRAIEPKLPPSEIKEGQSYISNLVSALDRGFYTNLVSNPVKGLATVIQQGTSAMTGGRVKEGPVSDFLNSFADKFDKAIKEVTPQDKEFQGSLSDQFAQALGQVGALVFTGGAGAGGRGVALAEQAIPKAITAVPKTLAGKVAAKAAPTVGGIKELTKQIATPASISAGLTVGQSEFERAKERGATDEQAFEAFYKNAATGSILEKIPVMQFLKRFNNATSGGVVNYLKTKGVAGITGGLEEATTEILQQLYANKTAQDIYNVNQNIFEGITESGGIGFGVGFLLNAMGAQAKLLRQQGREEEAQTIENQEQEFKAQAEGKAPAEPIAPAAPPAAEEVIQKEVIEETPQVPEAQKRKLKYRIEYFDPEKGKMTHSFFDTREEGDAFWSQLTDAQKEEGVKGYFELTTEPSFGEQAVPQVPPTTRIPKERAAQLREQIKIEEFGEEAAPEVPAAPEISKIVQPIDFSKQLEEKYGVAVDLLGNLKDDNPLSLSRIVVPEDKRRQGIGSQVMKDIIEYADNNNKKLTLTPSTDFGGESVEKLTDFYKQFGFVENKRENKDFTIKDSMYRIPELPLKEIPAELPAALEKAPEVETKEEYVKRKKTELFNQLKSKYPTLITGDTINPMVVQDKYMTGEDIDAAQKVLDPKILELEYDTELAALGVGEKVAPEVPATEKTQAETTKEQTIETDLLIGGQAAQRRKDGKYTKDGVEFVRNPKEQGVASDVTGEVRFTDDPSGKGIVIPFRYKLIEAETLQPSHQGGIRNPNHFIPEAQPKNRNDVGSLMAEDSFAFNPRFGELREFTTAYSGAPVVNERGEVIQGNNRSAGLRKGYKAGNQQYKNDLSNNAEQFGFTREQVEGMKEPVLVREIAVSDEGAIELGNYDVKDLETAGKRRLDATTITRRMPYDIKARISELLFTGEETINQAIRANQKRLLDILNPYLNQAQRNTITKDGVLTDAGIKDVEDIIKHFLFDNGDTALPDLFENLSATQKEGLKKALPYIFSTSPDKSIVPDIQEAILAVNDFKESGAGDFDAWLSQRDMFADGATPRDKYTPLEIEIARTLVESKTQKEIAKKFGDYADIVRDKPADMFEAARPGQTRAEGIKEVFKTEDYAKPISERGRKTLAREEKPTAEPSPKAGETERAAETARAAAPKDKRAEARQQLKDAFNDLMNLGVVYDPKSQAEKQVKLTKAIINVIREESIATIKDLQKFIKDNLGFDILDNDAKYLLTESKKPEYVQEPTAGEIPVQPEARISEEVEAGVPPTEPPKPPKEEGEAEGEKKRELDRLANNVPDTGKVADYLSKGTIEKYTGETPVNEQQRGIQELRIALEHGEKIIEKAKEIFGKDYVEKTLDYIENSTASVSNKALMYVSLENALGKEKLANPDRAGEITKQQALVYAASQAFARESSLALNYQKLRSFALVGYDISKITDKLFSSQELENRQDLSKAIEATPEQVNQAAEEAEASEEAKLYTEEELEKKVEEGVRSEIDKLFEQLPKKDKTRAEKALTVLADFKKKLRGRAYESTIGIPVAILDAGITTIENAIKLGIEIEKAVDLGIKKIKERWGKSWDKENDFRNEAIQAYKDAGIDTKAKSSPTTKKQQVKDALIKSGFGRTVTIKGEEREILDWKKLAGKAGSVERIQENVENVLKQEGYSDSEITASRDEFAQEYMDLRESIIEKALNELARRNKATVSPKQKTAAKRLAEIYSFGLFDQNKDEFENLVNSALGTEVDEKTFNEVKKIAEAMETIYNQTFNGVRLNDITGKSAIEKLEDRLRVLLYEQSKKEGNTAYKIASLVRAYMNFSQTMILNNLKNSVENFSSGLQQKLIDKLFLMVGKERTPSLIKERRQLMRDIYKDMIVNGGIGYGKIENEFVNRRHIDDYVNKLSDKKLFQGIASVLTGKATLNAMDAMFKAGLTEARFTSNLIRILTSPSNKKQMSKQDAIKFVSEQLTGQTLEDARVTAKGVIDKINQEAGQELIKPTQEQINRLANDIVKAALEMNGTITEDQMMAAYNAAYKSAGLSIGHESNNMLTSGVRALSAKYEGQINQAIKEKEWTKASYLIYKSVLWNNVLNPFVGGGTNWLVLKLEKTGLGLFTGLVYEKSGKKEIDVTSKTGMAQLEKRLYNQSRAKDSYMRGAVGGLTSLLLYAGFLGLTDDEEYRKWRAKNKWAAKYLDLFTPEYMLADMAAREKRLPKYVEGSLMGKNDAFSAQAKVTKALSYATKGDAPRAFGAVGEAAGLRMNSPLPWRLVRDGVILYDGIRGEDPYHGDYKPSVGFWSGVLQGGAIEWVGLRPTGKGKVQVGSFKVTDSSGVERDATDEEIKQVENLSNIKYKDYLIEYKNNVKDIWMNPIRNVKISKKGYSDKETSLWELKIYSKLTRDEQDQLDELIKRKALNDAREELNLK